MSEIANPAIAYINAIFNPDDIVEMRAIDRREVDPERPRAEIVQRWRKADQFSSLLPELHRFNADGYDIFVGVNPRPRLRATGDASIKIARSLYVDFNGGITRDDVFARFAKYGLPIPSVLNFSGHGWHAYWLLAKPITDLSLFTSCQMDLIAALGSDRVIKNPERIMRVPGFNNVKYAEAIVSCTIDDINSSRRYELCDILDRLPLRNDEPTPPEPDPAELEQIAADRASRLSASRNGSSSVIDAFNQAHDITQMLLTEGFTTTGQVGRLKRPGKTRPGVSVIVRGQQSFHFSSEDRFCDGKFGKGTVSVHDAFDIYCISRHAGNFKAAVRAASAMMDMNTPAKAKSAPAPQHYGVDKAAENIRTLPALSITAYRPFPVDQLPLVLRQFVVEAEATLQAEAAFIALPAMAAMGAAIGNAAVALVKRGFTQPPILWTAPVAKSGAAKSPTQKAAVSPVYKQQQRQQSDFERQMAEYEAKLVNFNAAMPKNRTADDKPPEKPLMEHTFVSDTTCEALAVWLMHNPRGVLNLQDELAAFFKSFNSYKQDGRDKETFLSMYDAAFAKSDRKTAEIKTIIIPKAFVAITGGIQPGVLRGMLNDEDVDSGLFARFLFAYPPPRRREWNEDEISRDTEDAIGQTYEALYAIPMASDDTGPIPNVLPLTPAAKELWAKWFAEVEDEMQSDDETPYQIALPKLRSTAVRIALILQLVSHVSEKHVVGDCIDQTSMARGIELARWFKNEQKRVYETLALSKDQRALAAMFSAIEALGGTVTVRDWQTKHHRTSVAAESDLARLVAAGMANWSYPPSNKAGGRPSKFVKLKSKTPDNDAENEGIVGSTFREVEVDPISTGQDATPAPDLDTSRSTYTYETPAGYSAKEGIVFESRVNHA